MTYLCRTLGMGPLIGLVAVAWAFIAPLEAVAQQDQPKPLTEQERKAAEKTGNPLLRDESGRLTEVTSARTDATVLWHDCESPHYIQFYTLKPGQTLYYHDWGISGPCTIRSYYHARASESKAEARPKPLSEAERKAAEKTGKHLLRDESGKLTEVTSARTDGTVLWHHCKPPHSVQFFTLEPGQTLYYPAWGFNGPCILKSYSCPGEK